MEFIYKILKSNKLRIKKYVVIYFKVKYRKDTVLFYNSLIK